MTPPTTATREQWLAARLELLEAEKELTRHSDHHYKAQRKYQVLRHFDESPQLPTGYPGCMILALVPPLWFAVMNPRVDATNAQTDNELRASA